MPSVTDAVRSLWDESVAIESLDLSAKVLVLAFGGEVEDAVVRRLRLEGVSSVVVKLAGSRHWEYAEASEVGLIDGHTLDIVLWDEPSCLTVTFDAAYLDDEPLTS